MTYQIIRFTVNESLPPHPGMESLFLAVRRAANAVALLKHAEASKLFASLLQRHIASLGLTGMFRLTEKRDAVVSLLKPDEPIISFRTDSGVQDDGVLSSLPPEAVLRRAVSAVRARVAMDARRATSEESRLKILREGDHAISLFLDVLVTSLPTTGTPFGV